LTIFSTVGHWNEWFQGLIYLDSIRDYPLQTYLQGIIDAPFLNLTPGTRSGVIHDGALQTLSDALLPLEQKLLEILEEQHRAEEERASARILRSVQKALKEALLALPVEEYNWLAVGL